MNNSFGSNFVLDSASSVRSLRAELNTNQGKGITDSESQSPRLLIHLRFTKRSLHGGEIHEPILQRSENVKDQALIKVERERQIGCRDQRFVLFGHRSPPAR